MNAPSQECRAFLRVVESFIDGELDPAAIIEGEHHTASCASCRERVMLGRAMKASVSHLATSPMGDDARGRLRNALAAEIARTPSSPKRAPRVRMVVGSIVAASFAAAAAWLFAPRIGTPNASLAEAGNDDVLSELVAEHVRPLPLDGTDIQTVRSLEQYVGVPLRQHFPASRAKLVGARILPFQHERAAIVQYELGGTGPGAPRRISVLVFDPRRIHLAPASDLAQQLGRHEVRMTRAQGLPVAVMEDEGIGYALSGDVDEKQAMELVRYVASP